MAPERIFMSVLLPAPFSPTSAMTSPGATVSSTPRNAFVAPKLRRTPRISRRGELGAVSDGDIVEGSSNKCSPIFQATKPAAHVQDYGGKAKRLEFRLEAVRTA